LTRKKIQRDTQYKLSSLEATKILDRTVCTIANYQLLGWHLMFLQGSLCKAYAQAFQTKARQDKVEGSLPQRSD
jgi:hypothetical protein